MRGQSRIVGETWRLDWVGEEAGRMSAPIMDMLRLVGLKSMVPLYQMA